jgi:hypothetical protein
MGDIIKAEKLLEDILKILDDTPVLDENNFSKMDAFILEKAVYDVLDIISEYFKKEDSNGNNS